MASSYFSVIRLFSFFIFYIVTSDYFLYFLCSRFRLEYSLTTYLVSRPCSRTSRYHWTICSSFSSCSTFASSIPFSFSSWGSLSFWICSCSLKTAYWDLKSAIENFSSFLRLKRLCSYSFGTRQLNKSSGERSSNAYSASMTGVLIAKAASR